MRTPPRRIETPHFPIFRRQPLSLRVTEILKRYILLEPLETGARLPPERRLAETLNVSRSVLREALSHLTADDILMRATPRTVTVAPFDRLRATAELAPPRAPRTLPHARVPLRHAPCDTFVMTVPHTCREE